jgi:hypothetical protein
MDHAGGRTGLLQAARDLQLASGIRGGHDLGARAADVPHLALEQGAGLSRLRD